MMRDCMGHLNRDHNIRLHGLNASALQLLTSRSESNSIRDAELMEILANGIEQTIENILVARDMHGYRQQSANSSDR
jgi:hypothetical protein